MSNVVSFIQYQKPTLTAAQLQNALSAEIVAYIDKAREAVTQKDMEAAHQHLVTASMLATLSNTIRETAAMTAC